MSTLKPNGRAGRITYADADRVLLTCPRCRQGARVDLSGDRIDVHCFGGCTPEETLEELDRDQLRNELKELEKAVGDDGLPSEENKTKPSHARRSLVVTRASEVRPERVRWLWQGRIPLGAVTLLAGKQGLGKSTLLGHLATGISLGTLEGDLAGEPAAAFLISYEDHARSTITPRLMAAGADLERVNLVGVRHDDAEDLVSLPDDLDLVEQAAVQHGARLVVLDPVVASLSPEVNAHRDQDVRRVLAPLAKLAERLDLAIVGAIHFNKGTLTDVIARVSGSTALTAAPRSVLAFGVDPKDPAGEEGPARVIPHAKCNVGPRQATLECRIEGYEVEAGEMIETSRLVIVGESDVRTADLLAGGHVDEPGELEEGVEFLEGQLAEGERPSREVKAAWKREGGAERTLQRAARELGVEDDSRGFPRRTYWRLPVAPSHCAASAEPELGATGGNRTVNPKLVGPPLQSRQTQDLGATGENRRSEEAGDRPSPRPNQVWADPVLPDLRLRVLDATAETVSARVEDLNGGESGELLELPLGAFGADLRRLA